MLPNPLTQLQQWYEEAVNNKEPYPEAITLATATLSGRPSARTVLYKGIDKEGILIYTNYTSRKAQEMLSNPYAAIVFYWSGLNKQIRLEGKVEKVSREESEKYFKSRPYESQISAWASEQSRVVPDRDYLLARHQHYREKFSDKNVPCPEFWGGFRIIPDSVEFWIEQEHRFHDRFCYRRKNHEWEIVRLAP